MTVEKSLGNVHLRSSTKKIIVILPDVGLMCCLFVFISLKLIFFFLIFFFSF